MTDYFALLGEARRPWLDPEKLKEKYFALARERPADAELNEAFRVLSDPKLRLHHLLALEGADLAAGRDVPAALAEFFWNTGTLLREVDRWLLKHAEATGALSRALLSGERSQLERKLEELESELARRYEAEMGELRDFNSSSPLSPNELRKLIGHHDVISYLTRLREQLAEKRFRLKAA
jgi:hypothetical protein